jgi:hypothetical protein
MTQEQHEDHMEMLNGIKQWLWTITTALGGIFFCLLGILSQFRG